MGSHRPTLQVLAPLVLLAFVGWLVTGGSSTFLPGLAPRGESSAEPTAPGSLGAPGPAPAAAADGERTEAAPEAEEPRTPARGREAMLRGRVVSDVLAAPLPGATVTVTRRRNSEFWMPDAERHALTSLLKTSAPRNMSSMLSTSDTFQALTSPLNELVT